MATTYRGLTIRIGGDVSSLQKSLRAANSSISQTGMELKKLGQAMKLDPTSIKAYNLQLGHMSSQATNTAAKLATLKKTIDQVGKERLSIGGIEGTIKKLTSGTVEFTDGIADASLRLGIVNDRFTRLDNTLTSMHREATALTKQASRLEKIKLEEALKLTFDTKGIDDVKAKIASVSAQFGLSDKMVDKVTKDVSNLSDRLRKAMTSGGGVNDFVGILRDALPEGVTITNKALTSVARKLVNLNKSFQSASEGAERASSGASAENTDANINRRKVAQAKNARANKQAIEELKKELDELNVEEQRILREMASQEGAVIDAVSDKIEDAAAKRTKGNKASQKESKATGRARVEAAEAATTAEKKFGSEAAKAVGKASEAVDELREKAAKPIKVEVDTEDATQQISDEKPKTVKLDSNAEAVADDVREELSKPVEVQVETDEAKKKIVDELVEPVDVRAEVSETVDETRKKLEKPVKVKVEVEGSANKIAEETTAELADAVETASESVEQSSREIVESHQQSANRSVDIEAEAARRIESTYTELEENVKKSISEISGAYDSIKSTMDEVSYTRKSTDSLTEPMGNAREKLQELNNLAQGYVDILHQLGVDVTAVDFDQSSLTGIAAEIYDRFLNVKKVIENVGSNLDDVDGAVRAIEQRQIEYESTLLQKQTAIEASQRAHAEAVELTAEQQERLTKAVKEEESALGEVEAIRDSLYRANEPTEATVNYYNGSALLENLTGNNNDYTGGEVDLESALLILNDIVELRRREEESLARTNAQLSSATDNQEELNQKQKTSEETITGLIDETEVLLNLLRELSIGMDGMYRFSDTDVMKPIADLMKSLGVDEFAKIAVEVDTENLEQVETAFRETFRLWQEFTYEYANSNLPEENKRLADSIISVANVQKEANSTITDAGVKIGDVDTAISGLDNDLFNLRSAIETLDEQIGQLDGSGLADQQDEVARSTSVATVALEQQQQAVRDTYKTWEDSYKSISGGSYDKVNFNGPRTFDKDFDGGYAEHLKQELEAARTHRDELRSDYLKLQNDITEMAKHGTIDQVNELRKRSDAIRGQLEDTESNVSALMAKVRQTEKSRSIQALESLMQDAANYRHALEQAFFMGDSHGTQLDKSHILNLSDAIDIEIDQAKRTLTGYKTFYDRFIQDLDNEINLAKSNGDDALVGQLQQTLEQMQAERSKISSLVNSHIRRLNTEKSHINDLLEVSRSKDISGERLSSDGNIAEVYVKARAEADRLTNILAECRDIQASLNSEVERLESEGKESTEEYKQRKAELVAAKSLEKSITDELNRQHGIIKQITSKKYGAEMHDAIMRTIQVYEDLSVSERENNRQRLDELTEQRDELVAQRNELEKTKGMLEGIKADVELRVKIDNGTLTDELEEAVSQASSKLNSARFAIGDEGQTYAAASAVQDELNEIAGASDKVTGLVHAAAEASIREIERVEEAHADAIESVEESETEASETAVAETKKASSVKSAEADKDIAMKKAAADAADERADVEVSAIDRIIAANERLMRAESTLAGERKEFQEQNRQKKASRTNAIDAFEGYVKAQKDKGRHELGPKGYADDDEYRELKKANDTVKEEYTLFIRNWNKRREELKREAYHAKIELAEAIAGGIPEAVQGSRDELLTELERDSHSFDYVEPIKEARKKFATALQDDRRSFDITGTLQVFDSEALKEVIDSDRASAKTYEASVKRLRADLKKFGFSNKELREIQQEGAKKGTYGYAPVEKYAMQLSEDSDLAGVYRQEIEDLEPIYARMQKAEEDFLNDVLGANYEAANIQELIDKNRANITIRESGRAADAEITQIKRIEEARSKASNNVQLQSPDEGKQADKHVASADRIIAANERLENSLRELAEFKQRMADSPESTEESLIEAGFAPNLERHKEYLETNAKRSYIALAEAMSGGIPEAIKVVRESLKDFLGQVDLEIDRRYDEASGAYHYPKKNPIHQMLDADSIRSIIKFDEDALELWRERVDNIISQAKRIGLGREELDKYVNTGIMKVGDMPIRKLSSQNREFAESAFSAYREAISKIAQLENEINNFSPMYDEMSSAENEFISSLIDERTRAALVSKALSESTAQSEIGDAKRAADAEIAQIRRVEEAREDVAADTDRPSANKVDESIAIATSAQKELASATDEAASENLKEVRSLEELRSEFIRVDRAYKNLAKSSDFESEEDAALARQYQNDRIRLARQVAEAEAESSDEQTAALGRTKLALQELITSNKAYSDARKKLRDSGVETDFDIYSKNKDSLTYLTMALDTRMQILEAEGDTSGLDEQIKKYLELDAIVHNLEDYSERRQAEREMRGLKRSLGMPSEKSSLLSSGDDVRNAMISEFTESSDAFEDAFSTVLKRIVPLVGDFGAAIDSDTESVEQLGEMASTSMSGVVNAQERVLTAADSASDAQAELASRADEATAANKREEESLKGLEREFEELDAAARQVKLPASDDEKELINKRNELYERISRMQTESSDEQVAAIGRTKLALKDLEKHYYAYMDVLDKANLSSKQAWSSAYGDALKLDGAEKAERLYELHHDLGDDDYLGKKNDELDNAFEAVNKLLAARVVLLQQVGDADEVDSQIRSYIELGRQLVNVNDELEEFYHMADVDGVGSAWFKNNARQFGKGKKNEDIVYYRTDDNGVKTVDEEFTALLRLFNQLIEKKEELQGGMKSLLNTIGRAAKESDLSEQFRSLINTSGFLGEVEDMLGDLSSLESEIADSGSFKSSAFTMFFDMLEAVLNDASTAVDNTATSVTESMSEVATSSQANATKVATSQDDVVEAIEKTVVASKKSVDAKHEIANAADEVVAANKREEKSLEELESEFEQLDTAASQIGVPSSDEEAELISKRNELYERVSRAQSESSDEQVAAIGRTKLALKDLIKYAQALGGVLDDVHESSKDTYKDTHDALRRAYRSKNGGLNGSLSAEGRSKLYDFVYKDLGKDENFKEKHNEVDDAYKTVNELLAARVVLLQKADEADDVDSKIRDYINLGRQLVDVNDRFDEMCRAAEAATNISDPATKMRVGAAYLRRNLGEAWLDDVDDEQSELYETGSDQFIKIIKLFKQLSEEREQLQNGMKSLFDTIISGAKESDLGEQFRNLVNTSGFLGDIDEVTGDLSNLKSEITDSGSFKSSAWTTFFDMLEAVLNGTSAASDDMASSVTENMSEVATSIQSSATKSATAQEDVVEAIDETAVASKKSVDAQHEIAEAADDVVAANKREEKSLEELEAELKELEPAYKEASARLELTDGSFTDDDRSILRQYEALVGQIARAQAESSDEQVAAIGKTKLAYVDLFKWFYSADVALEKVHESEKANAIRLNDEANDALSQAVKEKKDLERIMALRDKRDASNNIGFTDVFNDKSNSLHNYLNVLMDALGARVAILETEGDTSGIDSQIKRYAELSKDLYGIDDILRKIYKEADTEISENRGNRTASISLIDDYIYANPKVLDYAQSNLKLSDIEDDERVLFRWLAVIKDVLDEKDRLQHEMQSLEKSFLETSKDTQPLKLIRIDRNDIKDGVAEISDGIVESGILVGDTLTAAMGVLLSLIDEIKSATDSETESVRQLGSAVEDLPKIDSAVNTEELGDEVDEAVKKLGDSVDEPVVITVEMSGVAGVSEANEQVVESAIEAGHAIEIEVESIEALDDAAGASAITEVVEANEQIAESAIKAKRDIDIEAEAIEELGDSIDESMEAVADTSGAEDNTKEIERLTAALNDARQEYGALVESRKKFEEQFDGADFSYEIHLEQNMAGLEDQIEDAEAAIENAFSKFDDETKAILELDDGDDIKIDFLEEHAEDRDIEKYIDKLENLEALKEALEEERGTGDAYLEERDEAERELARIDSEINQNLTTQAGLIEQILALQGVEVSEVTAVADAEESVVEVTTEAVESIEAEAEAMTELGEAAGDAAKSVEEAVGSTMEEASRDATKQIEQETKSVSELEAELDSINKRIDTLTKQGLRLIELGNKSKEYHNTLETADPNSREYRKAKRNVDSTDDDLGRALIESEGLEDRITAAKAKRDAIQARLTEATKAEANASGTVAANEEKTVESAVKNAASKKKAEQSTKATATAVKEQAAAEESVANATNKTSTETKKQAASEKQAVESARERLDVEREISAEKGKSSEDRLAEIRNRKAEIAASLETASGDDGRAEEDSERELLELQNQRVEAAEELNETTEEGIRVRTVDLKLLREIISELKGSIGYEVFKKIGNNTDPKHIKEVLDGFVNEYGGFGRQQEDVDKFIGRLKVLADQYVTTQDELEKTKKLAEFNDLVAEAAATEAKIRQIAAAMSDMNLPSDLMRSLVEMTENSNVLETAYQSLTQSGNEFSEMFKADPSNLDAIVRSVELLSSAELAASERAALMRQTLDSFDVSKIESVTDSTKTADQQLFSAAKNAEQARVDLANIRGELAENQREIEAVIETQQYATLINPDNMFGSFTERQREFLEMSKQNGDELVDLTKKREELTEKEREATQVTNDAVQALDGAKMRKEYEDAANGAIRWGNEVALAAKRAIDAMSQSAVTSTFGDTSRIGELSVELDAAVARANALNTAYEKNTLNLELRRQKTQALNDVQKISTQQVEEIRKKLAMVDTTKVEELKEKFGTIPTAVNATKTALVAYRMQLEYAEQEMARLDKATNSEEERAQIKLLQFEIFKLQGAIAAANGQLRDASVADWAANATTQLHEAETAYSTIVSGGGSDAAFQQAAQRIEQYAERAASKIVESSNTIDAAYRDMRKTVEGTEEQFKHLYDAAINYSQVHAVSADTILEMESYGGQLGVAVENLEEFGAVASNLTIATDIGAEDVALQLGQMTNIMSDLDYTTFDNFADALVRLGNNIAAQESSIMNVAQRMAAVANATSMTTEELLGWSGAIASTGQRSESAATAIVNSIEGIGNAVAEGGAKLDGFAKIAGMSSEEFKKEWEQGSSKALEAFVKGLGKLTDDSTDAIAALDSVGISSVRQETALLALSQTIDNLDEAMRFAKEGFDGSGDAAREAEEKSKGFSGSLAKLQNNVTNLASTFGDGLIPYMDAASSVLGILYDILNSLSPAAKTTVVGITGVTTALAVAIPAIKEFTKGWKSIIATLNAGGILSGSFDSLKAKVSEVKGSFSFLKEALTDLGTAQAAMVAQGAAGAATLKTAWGGVGAAIKLAAASLGSLVLPIVAIGALVAIIGEAVNMFAEWKAEQDLFAESTRSVESVLGSAKESVDAYAEGLRTATRDAKEIKEESDAFLQSQADFVKAVSNVATDIGTSSASVQYYGDTIKELAGNCGGSAGKLELLKSAVAEYNKLTGTSIQVTDEETGKLSILSSTIDEVTASYAKQAEMKAYSDLLTRAIEEQAEANIKAQIAEKERADNLEKLKELEKGGLAEHIKNGAEHSKLIKANLELTESIREYEDVEQQRGEDVEHIKELIKGLGDETENTKIITDDYADTLSANGGALEEFNELTDEQKQKINEVQAALNDNGDSLTNYGELSKDELEKIANNWNHSVTDIVSFIKQMKAAEEEANAGKPSDQKLEEFKRKNEAIYEQEKRDRDDFYDEEKRLRDLYYDDRKNQLDDEYDAFKETLDKEYEYEKRIRDDAAERRKNQLDDEYEFEKRIRDDAYDRRKNQLDDEYEWEKRLRDDAYDDYKEQLDNAYDEAKQVSDDWLDDYKEALDAEVDAFEKATDERIALMEEEYEAKKKLIDDQEESDTADIDAQIQAIKDQTAAEEKAAEMAERQQKIAEATAKRDKYSQGSKAWEKYNLELENLQTEYANEDEKERREQIIEELEKEKDAVKEGADERRDILKESLDQEKEAYKTYRDEQKEELKKFNEEQYEEQKRLAEAQLSLIKDENDAALLVKKRANEDELTEIKRRLDQELEDYKRANDDELTEIKRKQDQKLEDYKRANEDELTEIKSEQDQELEEYKRGQDAHLELLKYYHEQELLKIKRKHEDELTEIKNHIDDENEAYKNGGQPAVDALNAVGNTAEATSTKVANAISDASSSLGELGNLSTDAKGKIAEALGAIKEGLTSGDPEVVAATQGLVSNMSDELYKIVLAAQQNGIQVPAEISKAIMENAHLSQESLNTLVSNVAGSFGLLSPAAKTEMENALLALNTTLTSKTPETVATANQFVKDNTVALSALVASASSIGVEVPAALAAAISENSGISTQSITELATTLTSGLGPISPDARAKAIEMLKAIDEGLTSDDPDRATAMANLVKALSEPLSSIVETAKGVGVNVPPSITKAMAENAESQKDKVAAIVTAIFGKVDNKEVWEAIANNDAAGYNNKLIEVFKDKVLPNAQKVATNVALAFAGVHKIASPSKLFAWYAEMDAEGFMRQWEKSTDEMMRMMFGTSDDIANAFDVDYSNTDAVDQMLDQMKANQNRVVEQTKTMMDDMLMTMREREAELRDQAARMAKIMEDGFDPTLTAAYEAIDTIDAGKLRRQQAVAAAQSVSNVTNAPVINITIPQVVMHEKADLNTFSEQIARKVRRELAASLG